MQNGHTDRSTDGQSEAGDAIADAVAPHCERMKEAYARSLQIEEKMTAQIANVIHDVLKPQRRGAEGDL